MNSLDFYQSIGKVNRRLMQKKAEAVLAFSNEFCHCSGLLGTCSAQSGSRAMNRDLNAEAGAVERQAVEMTSANRAIKNRRNESARRI
ncbi:MAG: hypothetical protein ACLPID_01580 [Beijerinckiaceae bacterium]